MAERKELREENGINISFFQEIGNPIQEKEKTVIWITEKRRVLDAIALDTLKEKTKEVIDKLHKMGFKTIMLTRDNQKLPKPLLKKLE